jgi:hypothetical protein
MEESADVIVVQRHAELSANEVGDALCGPQFVGPTVGFGALQKNAFELPLLVAIESGGRSRMGLGSQALAGAGLFEPAENSALMNAYDARDILYLVARMNGLHGLASSLLQSAGGSVRSAHDSFYADRQLRAIGGAAVNSED